MSFSVRLATSKGFGSVPADLRRGRSQLRPKLAAELRKPTKDIHDRVRQSILTAELPGEPFPNRRRRFPRGRFPSQGLRRPTARALTWKVSTAAGGAVALIEFKRTKMSARIQPLYPYWVGQKTRLRHPVMGNRRVWVGQDVPDVWDQTRALVPGARMAVRRAIDHTADIIAGKG